MSHKIALSFEDGVTRFITCGTGETVADAAYRSGINVPFDCRDGACGTCKSHCESGAYDKGDYIEDALTEDEAAEGYVLTCQMRPKSDCVVKIAATSALCKAGASPFSARLSRLERLSPTTLSFALKIEAGGELSFLPGQYANLALPGTREVRAYSFSSLPRDGEVEFLVRNIPGGRMSSFLAERAKVGDALSFTAPMGSFYLRPVTRPLLFLAGGTGLAPFLAMLDLLARDGLSVPAHLVYGVTSDADLVLVDRLEAFAARLEGFTFATVVADAASAHPRKGYVTHHLAPEHLNGGNVDAYLCGPPAMVDAVRHHFQAAGVTPAAFHYEKFSPGAEAKAA
ncbi:ring-hydroxylating dioxygenase ferredoxin reductase family protein [Xanthobacter autotrophicus]|uniref:benzoate 1,2-dioxygenase electron transfer component BenC n=1 Tax=Xanthobacter TaxID=279 RepID=UPI0024AACD62|nr:benzoate 1,2-dioxygenase electron transfer component BenC [Xanthobacter autotrophicus]MDI4664019.1 ring-hydroxylating dioxygenase ferredoxin reductase family protein [Xanthobacter autotrophicus]